MSTDVFGAYGGRYVPETLIPALDELERGWREALADDAFHAELHHLATTYAGRPTPLTLAERFAPGKRIYLKREDLLHTGAHKLNNALGQAVLARRLGKKRIVAETGAGQHGVATATVCARFGYECVVYMGEEDMRRQKPNVERMGLLGAEVRGVDFGTKTLKEATSEAIRDWITNVETTHYLIGSCVGPAPYPELVAELQSVIGREAREQLLAVEGRLPEAVVACVGGGSNAIGIFHGFVADDGRAPRSASRQRARRRSEPAGPACCTARARRSSPTRTGRSPTRTRSRPASTIRASAPSTRSCATAAARSTSARPTPRRSQAFGDLARTEGIIPALEPAHALARARELDAELILVCLSGRGDKDLAEALRGHASDQRGRPQEARHLSDGRAGDAGARARGGRGRRRHHRARLPVLGPARRRAGHPPRRRARARARDAHARVPRRARADARARRRHAAHPDDVLVAPRGVRLGALRRATSRPRAATSMIIADLPAGERPETRRVQLVAPTSTDERIALAGAQTDGWLYLVTLDRDDRRARRPLPRARRARRARPRGSSTCRSTPASASRRRSTRVRRPSSPTGSSSARARCRSPRTGPTRCATTSRRSAARS